MDEIELLLEKNPEASAYYALCELERGRLGWLCEHIRRCNFQISPLVARQLLSLLDPSENKSMFELRMERRSDVPPAKKDPWLQQTEDMDMALEVARKGGFERARNSQACHKVGIDHGGLSAATVSRRVRPYRDRALDILKEERAAQEYRDGKIDYLGRPICP